MLEYYKATAPGSCMLLNEYAVLFDQPALVCAIDRYIEVTLTPKSTSGFSIHSALGEYYGDLNQPQIHPPFDFVLTTIAQYRSILPNGFHLDIQADFSDEYGFGSSAAVTVATLAVLLRYAKQVFTPMELLEKARAIIISVQGNGSGADVAASVFGGLISYRKNPLTVKPLALDLPIHLIYSGKKVRTKQVIKAIIEAHDCSALLQKLMRKCGINHHVAVGAIETQRWKMLGETLMIHQMILRLLGTSTPLLDTLIKQAKRFPGICGAKISGSGFGDCIIALGDLPPNTFPLNKTQQTLGVKQFDINLSPSGVELTTETTLYSHP